MIEEDVIVKQLREIPEDQEDENPNLGPLFSHELYYKIDIVNMQNDRWTNTHVETFLDSW